MQAIVTWIQSNTILFTIVIWPAITAVVTLIFKPRSAKDYEVLPPRVAGLLRLIGALGVDVPNLLKAIRVLLTGDHPPPSNPPSPDKPSSEPPTKPDTPEALKKSSLRAMKFAAVFAGVLGCASVTGCSLLHAAVPVLTDIVAIIVDAQQILSIIDAAANLFFSQHPELATAKATYTSIAMKAHVSLDAAVRLMRGATEVDQKQLDAAFADFRAAYGDLVALAESLGMTSGGKLSAGPRAGQAIPQPLALTYRVSK